MTKSHVIDLISSLREENTQLTMAAADTLDWLSAVAFSEGNVIRRISRGCSSCKHSRAARLSKPKQQ